MKFLTEALSEFQNHSEKKFVQCNLCLHEIEVVDSKENTQQVGPKADWIRCENCGYKQTTRKVPGLRDLLIFGAIIGSIYLSTVVAVLFMR